MRLSPLPHNDDNNGWLQILPRLPPANFLTGTRVFDYAVVGGGFTGLAAARRLGELLPDARIALIDAGRIGNNAAGRCSGFVIDQAHNLRTRNFAAATESEKRQIRLNRAGQQALRVAVQQYNIDCDWREAGKIHAAGTTRGQQFLRAYSKTLDRIGEQYEFYDAATMREITGTDFYCQGLYTPGTQQIQPAALVRGLAESQPENVGVFENSPITRVEYGPPHQLFSHAGELSCKVLILANNGFGSAFGFYQKHLIPLLTYASMTRQMSAAELQTLSGKPVWGIVPAHPFGSSVRRLREKRILVRNIYAYSPGYNPTEKQRLWAGKKHRQSFLNRFPMLAHVPFEYSWGGSLCLSGNGNPIFGELQQSVFASLCHNGVGVARGTICGKLIAEQVAGHNSELGAIMLQAGRPEKTPPRWLLRMGVPLTLAWRRHRAGREL